MGPSLIKSGNLSAALRGHPRSLDQHGPRGPCKMNPQKRGRMRVPATQYRIKPVTRLEITILVDNYVGLLLPN